MFTGKEKAFSCKDRINMPYTDAVLFETMRKANIGHLALPHVTDKELHINDVVRQPPIT